MYWWAVMERALREEEVDKHSLYISFAIGCASSFGFTCSYDGIRVFEKYESIGCISLSVKHSMVAFPTWRWMNVMKRTESCTNDFSREL
jgi:hypothetical protein